MSDNNQETCNTVTINSETRQLTDFEEAIIDLCSTFTKQEKQKILTSAHDIIVNEMPREFY